MEKTSMNRKHAVIGALVLGMAVTALPALTLAQDATPVGSPESGAPMAAPPLPDYAEVVATGLANPRGMDFGDDGALYVAEAGVGGDGPCAMGPEGNEECFGHSGGVTRIAGGVAERVIDGLASRAAEGGMSATGPNDVSVVGDAVYVLIGLGGDPASRVDLDAGAEELGHLFVSDTDGLRLVVDVAAYETDNNPDAMAFDANPFAIDVHDDGTAYIVDAGMNALLQMDAEGTLSTLAVFPNRMAEAPDGAEIPMNSVPTGLATALDNAALVGELTGFPFPPGGASLTMVPSGGGDPVVIQEGFTNIIDVALGPDGSLYVLEMLKGGMLAIDPAAPASMEGQLTRIAPDGARSVLASEGLVWPTGLAVDDRGVPFVAVFGVMSNSGQVWKITPPA